MAADVIEFMSFISGPAIIVGHSLGGGIGGHIASKRPDLVPALVVEDANFYLDFDSTRDKDMVDGFLAIQKFIRSSKAKGVTAQQMTERTAKAPYPRPGLGRRSSA
jgi:pimeloyl-ACP methyl ester carboxylesterase